MNIVSYIPVSVRLSAPFFLLALCCAKSHVGAPLLYVLQIHTWLSIPMKWWTIFRQRLPLIRLPQMGHRRRICLKGQKKSLTVRNKKKKNPQQRVSSPHAPPASSPIGPSGAVADACSKCASLVGEACFGEQMTSCREEVLTFNAHFDQNQRVNVQVLEEAELLIIKLVFLLYSADRTKWCFLQ